jgi:RHS repeat-associated protein
MGYQSVGDGCNPKFTGQMRDSVTGSDLFNARYNNPAQGAFMSPDPENAGADVTDTQSWNGLASVTDNPINDADPSGLADNQQQIVVSPNLFEHNDSSTMSS